MITVEFEDGELLVTCSGRDFTEEIDSCKYLNMKYVPSKKKWSISPGKLKQVQEEFDRFGIQISEYDKQQINNYIDNLSTFTQNLSRGQRKKFNVDLMNYPPDKEFQRTDIEKALNQSSFLFKWDTGTGKSYALASLIANLRYYNECNKAIVLTSSVGILNLNAELKKFIKGYDESRTLVVDSVTSLKDRAIFSNKDYDIIISDYDAFKSICDYYDKITNKRDKKVDYRKISVPYDEWFSGKKGLIFFDECHLVTGSSHRTDVVLMSLDHFQYRYLFSATPTDKEEKFYPLLKIMDNSLVKGMSRIDWLSEFCELGTRFSRYAPNKNTWNYGKWALLQNLLSEKYMASRSKSLLNLPAAIDMPTIVINMSKSQRDVYESFSYLNMEVIKKKNEESHAGLVKELTNSFQTLQMAVDNPEIIKSSKAMETIKNLDIDKRFIDNFLNAVNKFNYQKDFNKISALEKITDYECGELGNKVIIFYFHPATLDELKKVYPTAYTISSEDDKADRIPKIEEFKKSKEKVIIASILIANTSFTLTECKAAIFYERSWSGIIYEQAKGRINRIGQKDETRYYNMIYDNSIDNLQLITVEGKGKVIEGLGKKTNLNPQEWKTILGGSKEDQDLFCSKIS